LTPERLRRVEQIFAALIEDGSANQSSEQSIGLTTRLGKLVPRAAELCGGDPSLCAEVESLLRHHFEAEGAPESANGDDTRLIGRFLDPDELRGRRGERVGLGSHELLSEWASTGTRIGGYTIIGQLGAGGMGVVYVAEQDRPRRTVALKLIRQGLATPALIRRFEREAEVLGRLSHPGIAHIFEAGVAELDVVARTIPINGAIDGAELARSRQVVPFIAMELVRGPTILEYVHFTHATPAQCMELIACVCDAVQHAHQRGVIHRDLKPQNILVGAGASLASLPQPKVLDFGVARAIDPGTQTEAREQHEHHTITLDGQMIGTLAYMSPEQVSGSSRDIDTRADVYALGAILYHLVCGQAPFDTRTRSIPELARAICHEEAAAPASINRALRGDIETIVRKAMAKDKHRRYQSAAELGEDIRRYLGGEAIAAKQDSALYVIRNQVKRHRALVGAALLAVLSLLFFAVYASIEEKRMARTARFAIAAAESEQLERARADAAARRLERQLSVSRIEQGRLLAINGDFHTAEAIIWAEHLQHPESIRSRWALYELYSRYPCERTIPAHSGEVRCVAWRPDGGTIATGGNDGYVRVWQPSSGAKLTEILTPHRSLNSVLFSDDGKILITAGDEGPIILWDAASGSPVRELSGHDGNVYSLAMSPDGKLLVSGGRDGRVIVWDLSSGRALATATVTSAQNEPVPVKTVRIDASGSRVAAGSDDGLVRLWSLPSGLGTQSPLILTGHKNLLSSLAFSPDGKLLASGSVDKTIKFWDAVSGTLIKSVDTSNGTARDLDFSPDGKSLASVGWWRVDTWDVQSFERTHHSGSEADAGYGAWQARYDPTGKHLVIGSTMGAARIWSMDASGGVETLAGHTNAVVSLAARRRVSDKKILLASTGNDGLVNLWTRESSGWVRRDPPISSGLALRQLALMDDGQFVAAAGTDGSVNIWDTVSGASIAHLTGHRGQVQALAFTHDGRYLLSGGADATLRIWERSDDGWRALKTVGGQPGEVLGISVSSDDRIAASSHRGSVIRFWSLPAGELLRTRATSSAVWLPAFANQHSRLALAGWDRFVDLLDVTHLLNVSAPPSTMAATMPSEESAHNLAHFIGHTQLVCGVSFDNSDSLLVSSAQDGLVKIWDASTGSNDDAAAAVSESESQQQSLLTLDAHAGEAFQAVFLPPPLGQSVAVGYRDGAVRIWDLTHFNRSISGQIDFQIKAHQNDPIAPKIDVAALHDWARGIAASGPDQGTRRD
jgi:WD40 repeat protein/serine/threonine protein kinase